jgi:hypothetical protein
MRRAALWAFLRTADQREEEPTAPERGAVYSVQDSRDPLFRVKESLQPGPQK